MDNSLVDPRWKDLYKLAGIAAVVSEFVIRPRDCHLYHLALRPGQQDH